MTAVDVQRILKKKPFQPLRFYFLEGETRDVTHPELVWVAGGSLFFGEGMLKDNVVVAEELGPIYALSMIKKIEGTREKATANRSKRSVICPVN